MGELPGHGAAADVLDRDRRAPDGDARRVQGARGRQARARRRRRGGRRRGRAAARALRPAGDRRARRRRGRLRRHGLPGHARRRGVRRAARAATRWSSSAPAGSCPASRSSSPARPPATSAPSTVTFPDDYGAEELAGQEAEFAVTVKEVKAKELPELDDDLAAEAGFDTLDELRDDIRERLAEGERAPHRGRVPRGGARLRRRQRDDRRARRARRGPRARAVGPDAALALATRASRKEMYLQISGRGEEDIVEEGKAGRRAPAQARGRARRRRRRRGASSRPRRRCSRRSRRPRRPSARARRSCSSG